MVLDFTSSCTRERCVRRSSGTGAPRLHQDPRLDNQPVFALIRQAKVLTIWEFVTKSLGALLFVRVISEATLQPQMRCWRDERSPRVKRHGASRHLT